MSANILSLARAHALAVSSVSAAAPLDRATADAAIRASLHALGGVKGCLAALAHEYGDHPELAAARMRWARQAVAELYPAGCRETRLSGTARLARMITLESRRTDPAGWATACKPAA